jgi:Flp pilus assembly protein TadB
MWSNLVTAVRTRAKVDETDIAICESTAEAIAAQRLVSGLAGAGVPLGMWITTSLGGVDLPVHVVMVSALIFASFGFQYPANNIRRMARLHRRRFRTSLSAYLDLVSIMLAGGGGIETALHSAADVGDGPTFTAISEALDVARATRRSPWDTLAEVGSRFGVDELPELAATVRLGGEQGARMTASLIAKASAMRSRELADVEARANEATERMGLPMVLLFIGFLVLLGYPAMHLITSGFDS